MPAAHVPDMSRDSPAAAGATSRRAAAASSTPADPTPRRANSVSPNKLAFPGRRCVVRLRNPLLEKLGLWSVRCGPRVSQSNVHVSHTTAVHEPVERTFATAPAFASARSTLPKTPAVLSLRACLFADRGGGKHRAPSGRVHSGRGKAAPTDASAGVCVSRPVRLRRSLRSAEDRSAGGTPLSTFYSLTPSLEPAQFSVSGCGSRMAQARRRQ